MLKRGLLFLLVSIIFLDYGLAQDSCLAVPQNPSEEQLNQLITESAARIWNTYSQIPKYSGDNNEILKAALEGLENLEPKPKYAILANYKKEIGDELRRISSGGSCIDDYSLHETDDCWNQDALCVEDRCVKFENLGWREEVLDNINKLRDQNPYARHSAALKLTEIAPLEAVPVLIKTLERDLGEDIQNLILITLKQIASQEAVQALRRVSENDPNPFLRESAKLLLASLTPTQTLELLRGEPLFERIYTNQKLSGFSPTEKNSISISVYRYLLKRGSSAIDFEIENTIDFILDKRRVFENEAIFGDDKYVIVFSHEDPQMQPEPIKEFARDRGVTRFPTITPLKGYASKTDIIDTIVNSKTYGETVIWSQTHGLPDYICLREDENIIGEESCFGFRYDEYVDILLQRGSLDEIILIIDSCFSYDFAEQLLEDLSRKNSPSYPVIITVSNKGRLGYPVFLSSLRRLYLRDNEQLLGSHIYRAEQYSFNKQDSAVFFSENNNPPLEIAMNSLNPSECGCTEDSCPIEPVQGTTS